MSGGLRIEPLSGAALAAALPGLAALRISVFRAFPYLYDGDARYEEGYLAAYADDPDAVIIGAFDGDRLVGAATGAPLAGQEAAVRAPFDAAGDAINGIFYYGESVLEPAYRGRGVGHAFFDGREAHARRLGLTRACFCAVLRADDHPARPADYRPLDPFWRARGYAPEPGRIMTFSWKDVGAAVETPHDLQVWSRTL